MSLGSSSLFVFFFVYGIRLRGVDIIYTRTRMVYYDYYYDDDGTLKR